MPTDATGPTTPLGIPTYATSADAPSGLGFNNTMQVIDSLISGRLKVTGTPSANQGLVWNGSAWVPALITNANIDAAAAIAASKLAGYPSDGTKVLKGDGTWGSGGDYVKLYDSIDAGVSLPAASITTPTLPGTYKHLRVVYTARSDAAANFEGLLLRFNSDSAANYDSQWLQAAGTGVSSSGSLGATAATLGALTAASSPAGYFGTGAIDIPAYRDTVAFKSATGPANYKFDTTATGYFVLTYAGTWKSTAAISMITFLPGAGNFIAGTRITVYGMN